LVALTLLPQRALSQAIAVPQVSTVGMRSTATQTIQAAPPAMGPDGLTYAERAERAFLKAEMLKISRANPGDLGAVVSKVNDELAKVSAQRNELVNMRRGLQLTNAVVTDISAISQVSLPTAFVVTAMDIGLDSAIEELDGKARYLTGEVLQAGLQELKQSRRAEYDKVLTASPAERQRILFGDGANRGLFDETKLGADASPEMRAAIAYEATQDLDRRLKLNAKFTDGQIRDLTVKSKKMAEQIAEARRSIAVGQEGQRRLGEAVTILKDQAKENTARLDVAEEYIWRGLSDGEKAKALSDGKFTRLISDPAVRKRYIEDLTYVANIKDYRAAISTGKQVASDLSSIGNILGAPPSFQETISFANHGMDVADAMLRMSTGSPLEVIGGLGALSRTFGGPRPDPTASALKAIQQQLAVMRQEMYDYHVQTMSSLDQMSDQIDNGFKSVKDLQETTISQVAYNTRALNDGLTGQLDLCNDVANTWTQGEATLDQRADTFNGNLVLGRALVSCAAGVSDTFKVASQPLPGGKRHRIGISSVFLPASLAGVPSPEAVDAVKGVKAFQDQIYLPTLNYSRRLAGRMAPDGCDADQMMFLALLAAGGRAGAARDSFASLKRDCAKSQPAYRGFAAPNAPFVPVDVVPLLGEPLSATAILQLVRPAYRASSIYEFTSSGAGSPRVLKLADILKGGDRSSNAQTLLERMKAPIDAAIVQHNMLAGDLVLEQLALDIENGLAAEANHDPKALDDAKLTVESRSRKGLCAAESSDPAYAASVEYFNAICILQANPFLTYNFTRYWLKSRLVKDKGLAHYAAGYHLSTAAEIGNAFAKPLPLVRVGARWTLQLPTTSGPPLNLELPVWGSMLTERQAYPGDFRTGRVQGDYYPDLLVLRADLEDSIAEYRASRNLTAKQKQIAYAAIVITARPSVKPAPRQQLAP
jgi:hypothetical protein